MICPFCSEEVRDEAIICKHCRSDLSVVRSLLGRIDELNKRLERRPSGQTAISPPSPSPAAVHADDKARSLAITIERRVPRVSPLATLLLALSALLLAHFIIIIHFDMSLIWLRIASLLLPFAFGFLYRRGTNEYLLSDLFAGIVLAAAAVFAMSAVVAKVDKVPALPIDAYGWREFVEYGMSIALSFFAGAVARQTVIVMGTPTAKTGKLVYLIARYAAAKVSGVAPHDPHDPRMDQYLKRVGFAERIITAFVAVGSALASIWSGLGQFL